MDWNDPAALTSFGEREPTEPWTWAGPARTVTGREWGGCIEVTQQILLTGMVEERAGTIGVRAPVNLNPTAKELPRDVVSASRQLEPLPPHLPRAPTPLCSLLPRPDE